MQPMPGFPQTLRGHLTRTEQLKRMTRPEIVDALAENGLKWLLTLVETLDRPPPVPDNYQAFLDLHINVGESHKIKVFRGSLEKYLNGFFDESFAQCLGFNSKYDFATTLAFQSPGANDEHSYEFGISTNGDTLVVGNAQSKRDANSGKLQFEDIVTHSLVYAARQNQTRSGREQADVAQSARNLNRIGSVEIRNVQTQAVISDLYDVHRLGIGTEFYEIDRATPYYRALVASNNGTLGPKFLGTNMATLKSGEISKILVRMDIRPASAETTPSPRSSNSEKEQRSPDEVSEDRRPDRSDEPASEDKGMSGEMPQDETTGGSEWKEDKEHVYWMIMEFTHGGP